MIAKALRLATAILALAFTASAAAQTRGDDAAHGVVRVVIIADGEDGRSLYGSGSGFLVAPNLVVTAAHVVAPARQRPEFGVAIVPPAGDGLLVARIIRYSPLQELALLEFRGPDLPALTISTIEPQPGEGVIAFGYPDVDYQGASGAELLRPSPSSRTEGRITLLREQAPTGDAIPTINHTAIISSGSSGGPLLDDCRRVIGVNSWHVGSEATGERRGAATRATQLLQFLDEAGVSPSLNDEPCLPLEQRVEGRVGDMERLAERLEAKANTAEQLMRFAIAVLIGAVAALFVAAGLVATLLLTRKQGHQREQASEGNAAQGLGAIVPAAAAAALALIAVVIGAWFWSQRAPPNAQPQGSTEFSGVIDCTLDRENSRGADGVSDTSSFELGDGMCVNGRTLYAPNREGRQYQRALLLESERALDINTIDPNTGEYRRERYLLADDAFASASQAVAGLGVRRDCNAEPEAVARRNQALMSFARGEPAQRLISRCAPRG